MAMSLVGIAAHVAWRVQRLSAEQPAETLAERPHYARRPFPLELQGSEPLFELRFADPERGFLVPTHAATAEQAARLASESGAGLIAIWVERNFHAGDWLHLEAVRSALPEARLIARDYVVDPWQLVRARAAGADGIELIEPLLGAAYKPFAAAAREIGLTPVSWESGAPRAVDNP